MAPRPDLPQLLIQAGMDILDEDGTEGLTLRRIAARAGVSHAAPAHHFGGLPGLKVAIATCGFQSFLDHLNAARDGVSDSDPFQRLLAVNLAYIQFASSRRGLFRLMFDQLSTQDPELGKIALGSYFVLKQMCAPFVQGRPAAALETAVWGLTHGYAALNMGQRRPSNSRLEISSYEVALRLLIG
ncbi:TetR/AcrR family transcriptional regulator [Paracoccus sp. 22332]|uniref:TetR/AcrR family transcriptional regulator n=1 Tax=Paracoccus sp. 22332 TaxID=3453913 RepID=UPI003F835619